VYAGVDGNNLNRSGTNEWLDHLNVHWEVL